MIDHNLETCEAHDPVDCDRGTKTLRDERDLARSVAVSLEQECADKDRRLTEAANVNAGLIAYMQAHGVTPPNRIEDITGTPV